MPLPPYLPRPVRILGSLLALLLATLWLATAPAAHAAALDTPAAHAAAVDTPAPHAATVPLERVSDFGANPGALNMYVYRPASLPAHPAVVVALHGCTQSAQVYADNSGLTTFADRHGFLLVFAETTSANNFSTCFNWFQPIDNRRGQGEAASIRQMVAHAESAYGADAARTYVTGLSAGGGMTSVMLAAYPDVFEAGAVIAGLPYDCTKDTGPFVCMDPGVDRAPAVWAQRVRDAYPGYSGPWPRMAIWHGDKDSKVVPRNADELRDQWTAVHGVDQSPDRTSTIGPNQTRREQYLAADGRVVVEVDRVPAIGHGTPVDPGSGSEQCGQTGTANFIASICSSYWITGFFGLDGSATASSGTGSKVTGAVAAARTGHCHRTDRLHVPGAERQVISCLGELTTAGTVASGHTDQADWAGLTPAGLAMPSGVPGIQIDGYFPDTSTANTNHGWKHDAQFVVRLPDRWNGGLVVAGSPGCASSTPTTAPSVTGSSPAAMRSPPPTRGTPARASTATAPRPARRSPNGTTG